MQTGTNDVDSTEQVTTYQTNAAVVSPPNNKPGNFHYIRRKKLTRKKTYNNKYTYSKKQKTDLSSLPKRPTKERLTYTDGDIEDSIIDEENEHLFNGVNTLRIVIAYYYRCILRAPPECEWTGPDGTIAIVRKDLHLHWDRNRLVRKVFKDVNNCVNKHTTYDGERICCADMGQPIVIKPKSVEESLIADYLEGGFGYRFTTLMVNTQRVDEGKRIVGRSAIMSAAKRMIPLVTKIQKRSQGNKNNEAWQLARFHQTLQMSILLREIHLLPDIRGYLKIPYSSPIPDAFNPSVLPHITRCQIVYFDEMHIEQHGGPITSDGNQVRFPRNPDGTFNRSGSYGDTLYCATYKYPNQARFCLGVAKVMKLDGTVEGRRCNVFDYTSKKVVTIKDYELAVKQEIKRVKNLSTKSLISPWIVDTRPVDYIHHHEGENIGVLKGVGKTAIEKFAKHNVRTIKNLKDLSDEEATAINNAERINKFASVRTMALMALPGTNPYPIVNLTKTNRDGTPTTNPYEARFGNRWREEIESSTALSPLVCVTKLVTYMMEESARVMADTRHSDDWYFYHDALSLMTAKGTRDWMKETSIGGKNCMSKWLVPMLGCNEGTQFENRSVGNSPEFMPLDNSLNNDVKIQHNFHCALTSHLALTDDRKFSNRTPKSISQGIRRLVEGHLPDDGVPSSRRIIQDCDRALDSMRTVCEHNGAIVPGLANRNGHRYTKLGSNSHGGPTVKLEEIPQCKWIHPCVNNIKDDRRREIVDRFMLSCVEEESDCDDYCVPTENDSVN